MKNKLSLKKDEWIRKIVSDPKESPSVSLITGFIGDSSEEGHIRIYFNLELSQFLDIKEDDILHFVELSSDESPFGGSKLWIKKASEVLSGDPSKERIKAKFFEGNIYDAYNNSTRNTWTDNCPTWNCNSSDSCTDSSGCPNQNQTRHNCNNESYGYNKDTAYYNNRIPEQKAIWTNLVCITDASTSCRTYVECGSKYCTDVHNCPTEYSHCPHDPHITNICKTNAVDCPSEHHNCYNRNNSSTYYCKTNNEATYYCNRIPEQRAIWTNLVCITDASTSCRTYVECGSKYCTDVHNCPTEYSHCPHDPHITNICKTNAADCPSKHNNCNNRY